MEIGRVTVYRAEVVRYEREWIYAKTFTPRTPDVMPLIHDISLSPADLKEINGVREARGFQKVSGEMAMETPRVATVMPAAKG